MNFFQFLSNRSDDFIELGVEHAVIVGASVLLSTLIGVGVGIATYRSERPRELVLAVAGVILTVPSFALFVLLLGPLGLGWQPVLVALTGYGLLPVLRNTITG
ncbi:MAG TPA: ABC transporter permease subunit, partial [Beutenbergiaceae bacterium]|nr:ABC transporter permease subunit [Beutenbergiaceae bacterium]